jgi:tetratricopeptide (TPR) repeat protein
MEAPTDEEAGETAMDSWEVERDRLLAEVRRLRNEGKLHESIAAAERMLELECVRLRAENEEILGSFEFLAILSNEAERWDDEAFWRREMIAWREAYAAFDEHSLTDVRWQLAAALVAGKNYAEGIGLLKEIQATYKRLGATTYVALVEGAIAKALVESGKVAEGAVAYAKCLSAIESLDFEYDGDDLPSLHHDWGTALYLLDRDDEALAQFQRAAELYDAQDDPEQAAWQFNWIGACHRDAGRDGDAVLAYRECLTRFATLEHERDLIATHQQLAEALLRIARHDEESGASSAAMQAPPPVPE